MCAPLQHGRPAHRTRAQLAEYIVNPLSVCTCRELQLDVPVWGERREVL